MRGLRGAPARDERGVVAVLVAVSLVTMFGVTALVVDLGNGWAKRRQIVTGVDAAALAAAQTYATGGNGCSSVAGDYLARNVADATMTDCDHTTLSATEGQVSVDATRDIELYFAPVLGIDSGSANGSTTARYGTPAGARELRPFGLCLASPAMQAWVGSGFSTTQDFVVPYGKAQPDDCGDAPGNWGLIDFNSGANSTQETKAWVQDGYPGEVSPGFYEGDPGAFSNSLPTSSLVGTSFTLPVFSGYNDLSGSRAEFEIVGFVKVRLQSFATTGAEADRFLELRFESGIVDGTCCGGGPDFGARVIGICRVEDAGRDC